MPNYGDKDYWEARYRDQIDRTFDWLQDYQSIKPYITEYISKDQKILHIGCGNSLLAEEMYSDGYKTLYNIDFSEEVIDQMSKRSKKLPEVHWEVMDIRNLTFPDGFFDVIIDKCTLDALLCTDCSYTNTARMTKEVQRVLKVNGVFLVVSCGRPDERFEYLQWKHLSWEISVKALNEGSNTLHFLYICKKRNTADEISKEYWNQVIKALQEEEDEDDLYSDDETSDIKVDYKQETHNELL